MCLHSAWMKSRYTATLLTDQSHGEYGTVRNSLHNLPFYFLIIYELEEEKNRKHKCTSLIYLEKHSNLCNKYQSCLHRSYWSFPPLTLSNQNFHISKAPNLDLVSDCYKYYLLKVWVWERHTCCAPANDSEIMYFEETWLWVLLTTNLVLAKEEDIPLLLLGQVVTHILLHPMYFLSLNWRDMGVKEGLFGE